MVWAKSSTNGNAVNLDNAEHLEVVQVGSVYMIDIYFAGSSGPVNIGRLVGSWATAADAGQVIQRLVGAVDPSDYDV